LFLAVPRPSNLCSRGGVPVIAEIQHWEQVIAHAQAR
jgi:hypothetical protein